MAEEPKQSPEVRPVGAGPEAAPALDVAGESLTRALRLSFSILTAVMLVLMATFLLRGFFTVPPDQRALVLRFGAADVSRVMDQGFHWVWPYPIEEVVRVTVKQKDLEVNTFWPKVTEKQRQEAAEGKEDAPRMYEGAEDGFLLTGDLNVLETRWNVVYSVMDDPQSVIKYYTKIGDEENERLLVKVLLEGAAVREVAQTGVFEAYPRAKTDLNDRVRRTVRKTLEELDCGIKIDQITLSDIRPPKDVKGAFDAVLSAEVRLGRVITSAQKDRVKILTLTAGSVGVKLGNAIEALWQARTKGRTDDCRRIAKEIEDLFRQAGGEVEGDLSLAEAYKEEIIEETKGDRAQMIDLLKRPGGIDIFMEHLRVQVVKEVLLGCYEKFVIKPQSGGTKRVIETIIDRHPDLVKERDVIEKTR